MLVFLPGVAGLVSKVAGQMLSNTLGNTVRPDMVALRSKTGPAGAQLALSNSDKRQMTLKMRPRDGPTSEWLEQFGDVLSERGLSCLLDEDPPSLERVRQCFPTVDIPTASAICADAQAAWWAQNTQLYHIVRAALDLSGPFYETDLEMIREQFQRGDLRDGKGLHYWAMHVKPVDRPFAVQAELHQKVMNTKVPAGSGVDDMCLKLCEMFNAWKRIDGNSVDRPAAFYMFLTCALDGAPEGSKMSALHQRVCAKVTDEAPDTRSPAIFIEKIL